MADDDRQPPQAYDTVAQAGVGATTTNQVSPGTIQEILDTGDRDLIDQAFDQIEDAGDYDALARYVESLPDLPTLGMPVQASSPAGVGSPGSQSFRSIHTTPESSPATPLSRGSASLLPTPRTATGGRTAAGAGGDGGGRRGPRIMRRGGGGRGGGGGAAGGAGAGGAGAGAGGGGGGGGGRRGGGGGRRGRRRRRTPTSPLTPASNPATPRGSWTSGSSGRQPRTLRQADLQRRLRMMLQDQEQLAQGREIANVTKTNSIVTSYKQGGAPSVQTSSSRVSP